MRHKLGRILEYLVQAYVMDNVEQTTLDLQWAKDKTDDVNAWSTFRLTPIYLRKLAVVDAIKCQ